MVVEKFTELAPTADECMEKLRSKYGRDAKIQVVFNKDIRRGGVFGIGAQKMVELSGTVTYGFNRGVSLNFEEEKKKLLLAAGVADPSLHTLIRELKTEVKTLQEQVASSSVPAEAEAHPALSRIEEVLTVNDFSPGYRKKILDRIRKEFSLDGLEDYDAVQDTVVEWIGESIAIYKEEKPRKRPRVLVLVGPTGVGKTTTIAKLAAVLGIGKDASHLLSLKFITVDTVRIGAKDQLETYGTIMDFPVVSVENSEELKETIAMNPEDLDMILVDTSGRSPRDSPKLGEMKRFLDACGSSAEIYLVLAATTKYTDLIHIMQQFEPFNYRSVIITKLDETTQVGNVISALAEKRKSVCYITDGQKVPADLQRAAVVNFLINLDGFEIVRKKIDGRFPHDETEKNQWR
jgi:flagellar biosynthesis protein FlhF